MHLSKERLEETIISEIENFVSESPGNLNKKLDGIHYFDTPLAGFADACDPLFLEFKDIIGDFYLTPQEVLERSFPEHEGSWDGSSVISWILPFSKSIRERNRREKRRSSNAWALAKTCGEEFNIKLREYIASYIRDRGFLAIVPTLSPLFEVLQFDEAGLTSNWSERHVAYVAGLGTFGLSGGLITERGIAMRCGSVVTNLKLSPTQRPYVTHQEYCLFYGSNRCGKCIDRCPGKAISQEGHNKNLCMNHSAEIMQEYDENDTEMPCCGLCQTAVPCEAGIPKKIE